MSFKNELNHTSLSTIMRNKLNYEVFGIDKIEQGELRLNNGDLAEINFDNLNFDLLSEIDLD